MQSKVCLIVCYYGKFPNYFQLWLNSAGENPDWNWLIFSDISTDEYRIPQNVRIKDISLSKLAEIIQSHVDFKVNIMSPYKLCDFRPLYGHIFSDDLAGYSHWGHCDLDVIWGQLSDFITDDVLNENDRTLIHGHLSIYKNSEEVNQYYKLPYSGVDYRTILSKKQHFGFDEMRGITEIFKNNKLKQYEKVVYADINFYLYKIKINRLPNFENQYIEYLNGHVSQHKKNGDKVREFAYVHLQKRKMRHNTTEYNTAEYNITYILHDSFTHSIYTTTRSRCFIFYINAKKNALKNKLSWNMSWRLILIIRKMNLWLHRN